MSEPKPMPSYWTLAEEVTHLHGQLDKLKAENSKLRELVIAQCECVKHDDCNECAHYSEGKCMFPFKSMYRELGIEVGE